MDRTATGFMCLSAALAGALVFQSFATNCPAPVSAPAPAAKPAAETLKPSPETTKAPEAAPKPPPFQATTQRVIPAGFRGDFAEDVHDCGSGSELKIAGREMAGPQGKERVDQVRLTAPQLIELDTEEVPAGFKRGYKMQLSEDGAEITFIFTNMKRIYQRCSARAHD
jgi:hypothetical protein